MAVQNPFFGKRDAEPFQPTRPGGQSASILGSAPLGSTSHATGLVSGGASAHTPATAKLHMPEAEPTVSTGSKLTVGPNIKLKGVEITDCDTLVVEGTVEATMNSRVIQIAEQGAFKGSADIDVAEIRGEFSGNLTVRQKLVIYSTGKVNGKIRYGKLVVEEGGQLAGEIMAGMANMAQQTTPLRTAAIASAAEPIAA